MQPLITSTEASIENLFVYPKYTGDIWICIQHIGALPVDSDS